MILFLWKWNDFFPRHFFLTTYQISVCNQSHQVGAILRFNQTILFIWRYRIYVIYNLATTYRERGPILRSFIYERLYRYSVVILLKYTSTELSIFLWSPLLTIVHIFSFHPLQHRWFILATKYDLSRKCKKSAIKMNRKKRIRNEIVCWE